MKFTPESGFIFSFYKKTVACSWWYTFSPCHTILTATGYATIARPSLQIFINYMRKSFVAQTAVYEAFSGKKMMKKPCSLQFHSL